MCGCVCEWWTQLTDQLVLVFVHEWATVTIPVVSLIWATWFMICFSYCDILAQHIGCLGNNLNMHNAFWVRCPCKTIHRSLLSPSEARHEAVCGNYLLSMPRLLWQWLELNPALLVLNKLQNPQKHICTQEVTGGCHSSAPDFVWRAEVQERESSPMGLFVCSFILSSSLSLSNRHKPSLLI